MILFHNLDTEAINFFMFFQNKKGLALNGKLTQ
jgi:hypothetical protein